MTLARSAISARLAPSHEKTSAIFSIAVRSDEGERRDQGAHPGGGDDRKVWPLAGLTPSHQQTGGICGHVRASRQCQPSGCWHDARACTQCRRLSLVSATLASSSSVCACGLCQHAPDAATGTARRGNARRAIESSLVQRAAMRPGSSACHRRPPSLSLASLPEIGAQAGRTSRHIHVTKAPASPPSSCRPGRANSTARSWCCASDPSNVERPSRRGEGARAARGHWPFNSSWPRRRP